MDIPGGLGEDPPTVTDNELAKAVAKIPGAQDAVPLRKIDQVWRKREAWRGFVLYCLSAVTWATLQHYRVDAMFAYDTYRVYKVAEDELPTPFDEIKNTNELTYFLRTGIVETVMNEMAATETHAICPDCAVGLTPKVLTPPAPVGLTPPAHRWSQPSR